MTKASVASRVVYGDRRTRRERSWATLFAIYLALGIGQRAALAVADDPDSKTTHDQSFRELVIDRIELGDEDRGRILSSFRAFLLDETAVLKAPNQSSMTRLLVSLSRTDRSALVVEGRAGSLNAALTQAGKRLRKLADHNAVVKGRLKIDLATSYDTLQRFDSELGVELDRSLDGLWLAEADLLLLPEELLSRRLVDSDGLFRVARLDSYLREGIRQVPIVLGAAHRPGSYRRVHFDSFGEDSRGAPRRLYRGNPRSFEISPTSLMAAAQSGGEFLLRHQRPDGSFEYRYQPKWDAYDDGQNLLRQAGTSYALLELYQASGDERFLRAARQAIGWLIGHGRPAPPDSGADFLAIVSPGNEAKLGGAALVILALVSYEQVSDDDRYRETARRLARFLVHQQEPDGHFHSKYFFGPPDEKPFESIYYPGEAILALLRLSELDANPLWLTTARRGADWLIEVRDRGKPVASLPHDHWLLMGLEALDRRVEDRKYLHQAERIAEAILRRQRTHSPRNPDWVGSFNDPPRSTPTATRAEALVAMNRLASRHGLDTAKYRDGLKRCAQFQLRTQLTETNSLYLPRPDHAHGGFRRALSVWEVRIDYVQHNVSALLGLRDLLLTDASNATQPAIKPPNRYQAPEQAPEQPPK